jgi:hypothetical protein
VYVAQHFLPRPLFGFNAEQAVLEIDLQYWQGRLRAWGNSFSDGALDSQNEKSSEKRCDLPSLRCSHKARRSYTREKKHDEDLLPNCYRTSKSLCPDAEEQGSLTTFVPLISLKKR